LRVRSAVLLCNPIDPLHALDAPEVARAVAECEQRAAARGITGKAVTPFLLSCLAEVTRGASLEANLALLRATATLAAQLGVEVVHG
jgi:pseudouridine-5'-phosphate glycosidase